MERDDGGRYLYRHDSSFWIYEREDSRCNLKYDCLGSAIETVRLPGTPIKTLQLVGKDGAAGLACRGKRHLKGIALDLRCDGTEQGKAHLPVVRTWGYH